MFNDDTYVDFGAYEYSFEEACQISGVSPDTLRSWLKRETAPVGKKHPKLHCLFFSGVDIIRLRVMQDMAETCGLKPSVGQAVADAVIARFWEASLRNPLTGKLVEDRVRQDSRIVVSLAGGEPFFAESTWTGETYTTPSPSQGSWAERFRRPHIVVPADQIIIDVQTAIFELHRRDVASAT
jgi:hypothetical protein